MHNNSYKNPLFFFDFDDTLIKSSDCQLIIKNIENNTERTISSHEFYEYVLKPYERIDYASFNQEVIKPIINQKVWDIFIDRIENWGKEKVSILTARDDPKPVKSFLKTRNIPGIKVNAVGVYIENFNTTEQNAENKQKCISDCIKINPGCDYVEFYDDSRLNIEKVRELRQHFPNIKIKTILVV